MRDINEITGEIVDAAYRIHSALGPGLLESVYETVMARRLAERGLPVERQKGVDFVFEGIYFEEGLKVDLLVDNQVIVELKSVEKLAPVHAKQLLTYLRLMGLPIGLLINFNGESLKGSIRRIVNTRAPAARAILDHQPSQP
ncbi:MAG TPA: GxxExxY protein [Longimicrobium sp.]|nr:GxxExxY protein [Longimicrobium sp.]